MLENEETDKSKNYEHLTISKINNNIYLGSYEHPVANKPEFQKLEIDAIVNCAFEIDYPEDTPYKVYKYPFEDDDYKSTLLDYIDDAASTINEYVSKNKKIYVHCARGMSRSPAVLVYYFMQYCGYTFYDALDYIASVRPFIEINPIFLNELRVIEEN